MRLMNVSEQRKFKLRLVNKRVSNPNTRELTINRNYKSMNRKGSKLNKSVDGTFKTKKEDFEHLQNRRIMDKSKSKI
jgi:exonuclease VII large subunit